MQYSMIRLLTLAMLLFTGLMPLSINAKGAVPLQAKKSVHQNKSIQPDKITRTNLMVPAYELPKDVLARIGEKIYKNETGANPEYLIAWNQGESFASLGIGHFIWFPKNLESPFTETFPTLLDYFVEQKVDMPDWLKTTRDFPWQTKLAYHSAANDNKMQQLRDLLLRTFDHQIAFIHQRMTRALPTMLASVSSASQQHHLETRFNTLASTELGMYALIDYVNFKGEGVSIKEQYQGKGWGLLQVLSNMDASNNNIHQAFSDACSLVLTRRVSLSSQQTVEQRWLSGWNKRCDTYANVQ